MNDVWKWVSGILAAALLACVSWFLTYTNTRVDELRTQGDRLTDAVERLDLLLASHGITWDNLAPINREARNADDVAGASVDDTP